MEDFFHSESQIYMSFPCIQKERIVLKKKHYFLQVVKASGGCSVDQLE